MKKIVKKLIVFPLLGIGYLLAICLVLSYLSIYISPETFQSLAYMGLGFQFFFVLNILYAVVYTCIRKKLAILHYLVLFPSLFYIGDFIRVFNFSKSLDQYSGTLKVVSYNVQMFQLPFKNKAKEYLDIAVFLNEQKADVICLQEFYTNKEVTLDKFMSELSGMKYHYVYYSGKKKDANYGVATFSRYPIKMQLEIPFEKTVNAAMYADIDVNGKVIRVYNAHLQSVKLNLRRSIRKIIGNQDEQRYDELEDVTSKLQNAFVKRARQVDDLAQHISVSPYPVILCGDFNDTPVSYTYHTLKGDLLDTFCEAGKGMPSTYRGTFPSFRIDYIFHTNSIEALSFYVPSVEYSDHYPVVSEISLK